ncbi:MULTISPECIES: tetratricopeptide repeat protein [Pseudanabaena]|nr:MULTISPECIES: tetratricopeptide repeat protein [Pseudanabaena]MDG3497064.1 tetratricopeptide repeat protein [Pseudanabaena catenata USMAC16]
MDLSQLEQASRLVKEAITLDDNQPEKAIALLKQALQIYSQVNRSADEFVLEELGGLYLQIGQYQRAIDSYEKIVNLSRQNKYRSIEQRALNELGYAYMLSDNCPRAIEIYQQALAIDNPELSPIENNFKSLSDIGTCYEHLGQYQKALEFHQQALAIAKSNNGSINESINESINGNLDIKNSLIGIAEAYVGLGKYQKANEFFNLALASKARFTDGNDRAKIGLGNVCKKLGKVELAIDFYQQALDIARQNNVKEGEINALNVLGNTYLELGQYQKAVESFLKTVEIVKRTHHYRGFLTALNGLGKAYEKLGQYKLSIAYFQASLAFKMQSSDRD